ncbi:PAS domain-containing protein [Microvirga lotononidis]|uniref:Blue-light-activated histidine kinase n=1 Tax=Microvirga lotononidis TaxID=864069 RepID=I4YNH8_9HYPH|nr:PAS domain-containing protein [Microvirga lotononidis]EIM25520.1 PAS domain S-box [Microvirga lotononidis]WQO26170.1 PAS domain-containing protein [Microvirga lotononidis]
MTKRGSLLAEDKIASRESDKERIAELETRLAHAEEVLRTSNFKLRIALDIGRLGAWERDLETDEVTGTVAFKEYIGLPPDATITYAALQAMFHPGDIERINQAIAYALRTRTDFNIEYRIVKTDGSVGHVHMRGGVIYENNKPVRFAGVLQDIKERQKIREEMSQAQRRQEFLLKLNDQLSNLDDPHGVMEIAARNVSTFLKVDTAGYGEVYEDRGVIIVEREWSRGLISNEGKVEKIDQDASPIVDVLKRGQPAIFNDVRTDPRLGDPSVQAFYSTINVRSGFAVPIHKNGRFIAEFYVYSSAPRDWTSDDISLVEDVAERTWLAIEKIRAETKLRETEARFKLIAESLPALVWIIKPNLELTYTNERWVTYSGLPPSQALGHSWTTAIHPDDWVRITEEIKPVMAGETPYTTEARYRSADGEYRWHIIRAAPVRNAATGEFKGWVGTSVDIHDLKVAEEALRTSEERLSLAQSAAGIGVFDWHVPTDTVTWTAEQERLFGMEPGSFKGSLSNWADHIIPKDRDYAVQTIAAALARHDKSIDLIFRIERPDGIRTMQTIALFFYQEDGSPLRMVGVDIDITHYKEAENRQNLLIRELHHRVKNTLATVQAIVGSTARSASSIDEFYQGFVGRIVSLARTHNLLTEDLWQKAALEELLQTELGPYEDEARNRITMMGPPLELPSEAAVPIGMAIHELTTNAAKHGALSTFGGQVEVRWEILDGERPMLHFSWVERGGPRVGTPSRQGFGTRLLQRVLSTQLQAEVSMEFSPEGLRFSMQLPIPTAPPTFNPDT